MRDRIRQLSHHIRLPLLLLSIAIFLCVTVADYVTTGQLIDDDPSPQIAGLYLVRSFFIALSALLFVISPSPAPSDVAPKNAPSVFMTLDLWRGVRISIRETVVWWFSLLFSCALVLLFVFNPVVFSILSNEDQIVETMSAILLFGACVNLVIVFLGLGRQGVSLRSLYSVGLVALAVSLLVIGMEEVSWFQRSFGFETPEALSANVQGEFNLHNLASTESEILYYLAAFIYLIVFPFLHHRLTFLSRIEFVSFFSPSLNILFVAAPLAAFNFNLWNNATIQFAFFATLVILMMYAHHAITKPSQSAPQTRYYLTILCFAYLISQVLFISQGHRFLKGWEVTEYKELLIPMTFFIYSLEMVMRTRRVIGLKVVLSTVAVGFAVLALRILQELSN